jgi:hypothetical protein
MRDMNIGGGGNSFRVTRLRRDTRTIMERDESDRREREARERGRTEGGKREINRERER